MSELTNRGAGRWWGLAAISLAVMAVSLDVTVLSVALPTLAAALHASETDLQWFSSGYALALAAGMLPAGLLGDRYGRRAVLVGSLVLFGVGSLICACAPSPLVFSIARILVGLAGAGVIVMALSVITVLFDSAERPRAVAIWGAANFLALPVGPIVGGWLLANAWWGWVFLVNVPVAIVALVAALVLVPESRATIRPSVDVLGVLLSSVGLVVMTYGLIEAGSVGWTDPTAVIAIVVGVLMLVAFFLWERRLGRQAGGQPLVDLRLFASPAFTWGVLLVAIGGMAMIGTLFTLPQYFQAILGTDAQGSGLRLLPTIFGLVIAAVISERVAPRLGSRVTVATGFAVLAAAMFVGATTRLGSGDAFIAGWTFAAGFGMGLAFITAATGALVDVPAERSGVGAGVMQAVQKLGAPFGSAILGSVLAASYRNHLDLAGLPAAVAQTVGESVFAGLAAAQQLGSATLATSVRTAFVAGMNQALLVSTGIAVVGAVLSLAFLPGRRSVERSVGEERQQRQEAAAHV